MEWFKRLGTKSVLVALLISAGFVIIGIILLWLSEKVPDPFDDLAASLGTFIVGTVVVANLWEFFGKQSLLREIENTFRVSEEFRRSGLKEIGHGNGNWLFSADKAREVDILFGYSGIDGWPGQTDLKDKIWSMPEGARIRVTIPHPRDGSAATEISDRLGKTTAQITNRLTTIRCDLLEIARSRDDLKWELRVSARVPLYSYMRCDDRARVQFCEHNPDHRGRLFLEFLGGGEPFEYFLSQFEGIPCEPFREGLSLAAMSL